jgi:glutamate-1-semialdehyde 2,1-aminomutase
VIFAVIQKWGSCFGPSAPNSCRLEWTDAWLLLALIVFAVEIYKIGLWLIARIATMRAAATTPAVSRLLSRWVKTSEYLGDAFFRADGAPAKWVEQRKRALDRLAEYFRNHYGQSVAWGQAIRDSFSDLRFTDTNRVPFPFVRVMREKFNLCTVVTESQGPRLKDLDGHWTLDVSGSYGVNVAGFERYKEWIQRGCERVKDLGPVLGPLHPIVAENISTLKRISGMDEVSFHMSGTEAVMAAVRLVRFNTRRKLIVCFSGAYHGWWDGVLPGLGSERDISDCLTLKDLDPASLTVLRRRAKEIAGVLVNPVQSFHPNSPPPNDAVLLTSGVRKTEDTTEHYRQWLHRLREVCRACNIPLIFDEVYSGFRLAPGGAQQYFNVQPDMVVYGKTVAGGMPIGVVCGKKHLMRRFDPKRPMRLAYVVGTFSAHPPVMGAMTEFLHWVTEPETARLYQEMNQRCSDWVGSTNEQLAAASLPVRIMHLGTVWTVLFKEPSRYNWLLQYYLRAEGVTLSWVGTGRCLTSMDFTVEDYQALQETLVQAVRNMKQDGWWLDAKQFPEREKVMKRKLIQELVGSIVQVPQPLSTFYAEVMQRKHDDHHASHSNGVNQALHLLSSSAFIYCYYLIFSDLTTAMCLGLASLFVRQFGHAVLEPPCHDKEKLLLGYNTRNKTLIVLGYVLIPFIHLLQESSWSLHALTALLPTIAQQWFLWTLLIVCGRVVFLMWKHGFYTSMIWFVKLITDPLTDIVAYFPRLGLRA